jgi:DNA-binding NarL/FixJ family response regulator
MNMRLRATAAGRSMREEATMGQAGGIEVAVVEDDRGTREGLALLIDGTPGYRCVQAFRSVEEALRGLRESPDVLLLDISLPGLPGSEGVRLVRERHPRTQVLMLTVFDQQERVFESICNGACGYLLKKTPPAQLLEAIRQVHEGGAPMTPEIARKVVGLLQAGGPPARLEQGLTAQEARLLRLLADGASYALAAERLHVSVNTVRSYIRVVYDKLHVHSKSAAVSKALRSRLI